jgi:2'-5' RNA ligase
MKPLEKIRTFIEVRLSEKTQKRIIEFSADRNEEFKKEGWKVRWVHPDNVHLTIRFLGDIHAPLVNAVRDALSPLSQLNPFPFAVKGVGAFPSFGSPRVIWVGIADPDERLAQLAARIDDRLASVGFKSEARKFRPHVTIGRVSRRGSTPLADLIGSYDEELFGEEEVREFQFMKSQLGRDRAVHTPLFNVAFRIRRQDQTSRPPPPPSTPPPPPPSTPPPPPRQEPAGGETGGEGEDGGAGGNE